MDSVGVIATYGWIPYWGPPGLPAPPPPVDTASVEERREAVREAESTGDPHLRSIREVLGYHVLATDGEIGHIEDFLLDDDASHVLFLVVNLGEWLSKKQVLISPPLISKIDWASSNIVTEASSQAVKSSPEYEPSA